MKTRQKGETLQYYYLVIGIIKFWNNLFTFPKNCVTLPISNKLRECVLW